MYEAVMYTREAMNLREESSNLTNLLLGFLFKIC